MQARTLMARLPCFSGALMLPRAACRQHHDPLQGRRSGLQQEVDATALGGGKQGFVVKTTSFVQLTLTDTTRAAAPSRCWSTRIHGGLTCLPEPRPTC